MTQTPYNSALDLLAARPYTVKDLKRKLHKKGFESHAADDAVQRLLDNGLLDDTKYAAQYARSKLTGTGASSRRIRQDLLRKGVPSDVADSAIEKVVEDEQIDTAQIIEKVAQKKLASMGNLEPLVLKRRLYAFLARRGYDLDEIGAVVRRLLVDKMSND